MELQLKYSKWKCSRQLCKNLLMWSSWNFQQRRPKWSRVFQNSMQASEGDPNVIRHHSILSYYNSCKKLILWRMSLVKRGSGKFSCSARDDVVGCMECPLRSLTSWIRESVQLFLLFLRLRLRPLLPLLAAKSDEFISFDMRWCISSQFWWGQSSGCTDQLSSGEETLCWEFIELFIFATCYAKELKPHQCLLYPNSWLGWLTTSNSL